MTEIEMSYLADTDTTCTICNAEFLDPDDLEVHVSQMHSTEGRPTFKLCQFCTKYVTSLEDYAIHIRNEHLLSLKCCKYCNRVFDDFDEHRKHESKHYTYVAKSMYSCSNCQKLFNNISELELHETKEHAISAEGVFITDCLPFLSSVLNIKALKFLQSLDDEVNYICICCEKSTSDPKKYLNHLKRKNCTSLACNGCSWVFRNKKSLIRHLDKHLECVAGGKHVYKQCTECYKMFEVKLWKDHTKHCKAIKCKICHVVFSSMYDLSRHQTNEHPLTVSLESCKYCHKEFAGEISLNKHIERAHSHDAHLYKYICMWCTAIFKHPKKLFAHFYSTHKELEPYTCKICDKKFKIRKKFTIHIKLDHKSIGYIEFDENYHVFFTDKKSEKPPKSEAHDMKEEKNTDLVHVQEDNLDIVKVNTGSKKTVHFDNEVSVENKTSKTVFNVDSDFMSATETEGHVTEREVDKKPKLKRKIKTKIRGTAKKRAKKSAFVEVIISDSSDDEPLVELKKRVRKDRKTKLRNATWNRKKQIDFKNSKKRFICNICKKYCYTFQNYHNHVALHYTNVTLKCVKCSETFTSQQTLNEHYSTEHSTSQLTQTLRSLLEKRKSGIENHSEVSSAEKFQRTIKKVNMHSKEGPATLTEVSEKLSVQKFIENFTPEDAPRKKCIEIDNAITMTPFSGPCKNPSIVLTKCNLVHMDFGKTTLSMPKRFHQVIGETQKVTIRKVDIEEMKDNIVEEQPEAYEEEPYFEDDNMDRNDSIPDVAQEVMLEITEEPAPKTLYIPHKVVLPNLPKEYKKIRIAHLQSEAPYYKIVKVEDVLNPPTQEEKISKQTEVSDQKQMDIKLPDGTKLVTVNPLAHLLGDTPVEKIMENSKNKYYQPKSKDFEVAIAKAMLRLEKPEAFPRRKKKKTDTN